MMSIKNMKKKSEHTAFENYTDLIYEQSNQFINQRTNMKYFS